MCLVSCVFFLQLSYCIIYSILQKQTNKLETALVNMRIKNRVETPHSWHLRTDEARETQKTKIKIMSCMRREKQKERKHRNDIRSMYNIALLKHSIYRTYFTMQHVGRIHQRGQGVKCSQPVLCLHGHRCTKAQFLVVVLKRNIENKGRALVNVFP